MIKKLKQNFILLVVFALIFAIFFIQFDSKDFTNTNKNYLCSSTLPYGTSIMFNSLSGIFGEKNIKRFRRELQDFPESEINKSSIFLVGIDSSFPESAISEAYNLAEKGANVIISFSIPKDGETVFSIFSQKERAEIEDKMVGEKSKEISQEIINNFSLSLFSNNSNYVSNLSKIFDSKAKPTKFLPQRFSQEIKFYSKLYFSQVNNFVPIYTVKRKPVAIMKLFKKSNGRLIAMSSSYFFTNESFKSNDNNEKFLSFLLEDRNKIYFDERHLGLKRDLNVAWLLRQYDLEFALMSLLICIILFIWQNLFGVPVSQDNEEIQKLTKDLQFTPPIKRLTQTMIKPKQIVKSVADIVKNDARQIKITEKTSKRVGNLLTDSNGKTPLQKYNAAVDFLLKLRYSSYNLENMKKNKIINKDNTDNE